MTEQTEIGEVSKINKEIEDKEKKKELQETKEELQEIKEDFDAIFDKCYSLLDYFTPRNEDTNIHKHLNALASVRLIYAAMRGVQYLNEESEGTGEISINRSRFIGVEKLRVKSKGMTTIVNEEKTQISESISKHRILDEEMPRVDWDEVSKK